MKLFDNLVICIYFYIFYLSLLIFYLIYKKKFEYILKIVLKVKTLIFAFINIFKK